MQTPRGFLVLSDVSVPGAGLGYGGDLGNGNFLQSSECGLCGFSGQLDLSTDI